MNHPHSRTYFTIIILSAILTLSIPASTAYGQPGEPGRLQIVGQAGGAVSSVLALPDNTLLVAEGSSLLRIQSLYGAASILARSDLGYGAILNLAGEFPRLYALTEKGILSLEMGNGALPRVASFTPGGGQSMLLHGDLMLVAARELGLRVLRTGQSSDIQPLTTFSVPGGAYDLAFSPADSRLYVAAGDAGAHVIDLTDPATPHLLATFTTPAPADAVSLAGSLLAVGSEGRVSILDPSTQAGNVIGVHAPLADGQRIIVDGDYAYIADGKDGLKIIWLAAPDRPVQIYGEHDRPAFALALEGERLYAAGGNELRLYDVSNRYRPSEIASLPLPGQPQAVAITLARHAYVALGDEGIAVVDLENESAPQLEKRISIDGTASALVAYEGQVYTATGDGGIVLIDASQPGSEVLFSTLPLPGPALDITRRGKALYVAAGEAGLLALDITRPGTPVLVGTLAPEPGQRFESIMINGKRAFVAYGEGFAVIDVNRPQQMGRLAHVEAATRQVGISGVYAYALGPDQITVYDVRATAEPVHLRTYLAPRHISGLSTSGDRLFLTHDGPGPDLVVLSLASPGSPVELDNVGSQGDTVQAYPAGETIWLAGGRGGLHQYALSEGGALIPRGGLSSLREVAALTLTEEYLFAAGPSGWLIYDPQGSLQPVNNGVSGETSSPVRDLSAFADKLVAATGEQDITLYRLDSTGEASLIAQGQASGPVSAVALDDRFVYAADADGLSIFDQHYLLPVRRVITPAPAVDLAVRDHLAYLPLANGQLAVIDLSDPLGGVQILSSIETRRPTDLILTPQGQVYGLADDLVSLLRVSTPEALAITQRGFLPVPAERGVFVGDLLGAYSPGSDLSLYDLTFLDSNVIPRGELALSSTEDLAVTGAAAYLAYGEGGLGLADIRSPGSGQIFYQGSLVSTLYLDDTTLFAAGDETLTAWDVSQPFTPQLITSLELFAPVNHIDPAPDGRLLLSQPTGLSIVHFDGETLSLIGTLYTPGAVRQAAQIDRYAYLALPGGGLHITDLVDPANPQTLFTLTSPSGEFVSDLLSLDGDHLLVSWESGIDVLTAAAGTTAPRLLNLVDLAGESAYGIAISSDGGRAAVTLGDEGTALLDLSTPDSPVMLGLVGTAGDALAAALDEDTLFVASGRCGVSGFDLSDPASPRETAGWQGTFSSDIALTEDRIYLADGGYLVALHYDPSAPDNLPPVPQTPFPADGAEQAPLSLELRWGPSADVCNPLTYEIYLGLSEDPPLVGRVAGQPNLEIGELTPLRTYTWRVDAIDRRGNRVQGPLWHFSTSSAVYADAIPPAPPPFTELIDRSPGVPLALAGGIILLGTWVFFRRMARRNPTDTGGIPDWYSSSRDDE